MKKIAQRMAALGTESAFEVLAQAKALEGGPIVIADHGDNSGAGGPSDDMSVIAEMLDQGLADPPTSARDQNRPRGHCGAATDSRT